MPKPSLVASLSGLQQAKAALLHAGITQKALQLRVNCSRQPITNFFKGMAIAQSLFIKICAELKLDWRAIADLPHCPDPKIADPQGMMRAELDNLVRRLRQVVHRQIQTRCGTLRVLDMTHPVALEDLYTSVNVLEKIARQQRRRLDELMADCSFEDLERFGLNRVAQARLPALDVVQHHEKLILLGRPGAGKTTFLKHLAMQCNAGRFEGDPPPLGGAYRVPIFILLKDFAEAPGQPRLLEYISQRSLSPEVLEEEPPGGWVAQFEQVLQAGRSLLLLDGLDEVRQADADRVLDELRSFTEQYHRNRFLMTCRVAAWEYTFELFTEVEVADFDTPQIEQFVTQWFARKPFEADTFLNCLAKHLRIRDLATNPLLLTLLCLAFETSGDLPGNRQELYREGIDALLKKWDATRGIHRDAVYKNLSHLRKKDLLSQIALDHFRQQSYFIKQSAIEYAITQYIRNLPDANADLEALQVDSEAVLQSIEAQHGLVVERAKGIYSFAHLTFHEYFVARHLVFRTHPEVAIAELLDHLLDRHWREVLLLAAEMMPDASLLLLPTKQRIDQLLADDPQLQEFLQDVCDRAALPEFAFLKPAIARAFYFDIDFDIDEERQVAVHLGQSANLLVCASFFARVLKNTSLAEGLAMAQAHDAVAAPTAKIAAAATANQAMILAMEIALQSSQLGSQTRSLLKPLLAQAIAQGDEIAVGQAADEARDLAKQNLHIGGWRFDEQAKLKLRRYYDATLLLVDCLNCDVWLPGAVREEIERSLFAPVGSLIAEADFVRN